MSNGSFHSNRGSMSMQYLVSTGVMATLGHFTNASSATLDRGQEVVCRTGRGLEVGRVIAPMSTITRRSQDGQILRPVTDNDRMILERLARYRDRAFQACSRLIEENGVGTQLLDVEQLFDGESLYFYFLGPIDYRLEKLLEELGRTYEQKVRFRQFAERLANGCGPDCGGSASRCGSNGCTSCALVGSCGSRADSAE